MTVPPPSQPSPRTMEPFLLAQGLRPAVARIYSEGIETERGKRGTPHGWESAVLSALITIAQLESLVIDEGMFHAELLRLGYIDDAMKRALDELRRSRARRRGG